MPRKKKANSADGLHFVVSNGPKPPSDPAVRTIIRRQAMRDVGVERRVRNAEKKLAKTGSMPKSCMPEQLEQQLAVRGVCSVSAGSIESSEGTQTIPDVVFEDEWKISEDYDSEHWFLARHDTEVFCPSPFILPVPMTGYEATRSRFGVDLSMLDRLTSFSVGKTTMGQLAEDPFRIYSLVVDSAPERTGSYLALVPKRYGESRVLSAVTDCLLAKANSTLMPCVENEVTSSKLYARALNVLQRSIADDGKSIDADLVCAVQMMTLNELLDPSRIDAYANHVAGSTRLMEHRSPRAFKDEFEKALFHSHVGPVVSEALHNNTHCYLAEPEWTALYESLATATDKLTERHELVISARKLIFPLPGLWHDVSKALKSHQNLQESVLLHRLEQRCRALDSQYAIWREAYKEYCMSRSLAIPTEQEVNIRRETYGQALESLLIVKMLLATVISDASVVAEEIRVLAKQIMDLQRQPVPKHSWLFTGQEVGVAQVAIATCDNFLEDLSHLPPEERLSKMQRRYMCWSGMLRGS
ncbi:hypothetical protein CB0940_06682 [Cercospora beticola]|uniref:Uncharacterized protein n=1 Tax=Cercospora beticola TaxID=122368 RepID=A0A2G5I035_CERBT|nr:hypothetical protein CB0940_06682 [Cercospora beticola]PIA98138.1 hypothetical protein CB0940_06682 [Cercospora beticola]WPA99355.1 hypothetical protein RHO25_003972 [Cercospora beticola]CAK1360682.1 unnamed protein product [Cercospora beticola]